MTTVLSASTPLSASPEGVDPVAAVSPAAALTAAAAAPDGYAPDLAGVVPRLNYYFEVAASRWRLVYILQDVPVTLDRTAEPQADQESELEPPRFVDYVVDAHDGQVVAILPRTPSMTAGEEQTATDSLGVERTFLALRQGGSLVLNDPVHNVQTYDFSSATRPSTATGCPVTASPTLQPGHLAP